MLPNEQNDSNLTPYSFEVVRVDYRQIFIYIFITLLTPQRLPRILSD